MSMKIWLSAIRVRQWNKQALIILPFIALGDEVQVLDLGRLIVIAIAFSLVASSIYIFNDIQDLAADKLDAIKSKRPFAAGAISTQKGKFVGVILLITGFLVMFQIVGQNKQQVLALFSIYFLSNLLYSRFNLKEIRIVGLMIVGLGFAIRFSI
jgi:decaprenyl-phosphate phosphoribosyltransferase